MIVYSGACIVLISIATLVKVRRYLEEMLAE